MSASLIFKAGALALACASTASASYVILDDFSGPTFFDNFYFNATLDPTNGFVEYIGAGDPLINSLAYYDTTTGTAVMRVDDTKTYTPGVDLGRPSIRAQTLNTYQYGLFILDLAHMPGGACGSWPAFWTTSMNHWPEQGEIDIIENVNFATWSDETLHTGPVFPGDVCELVGNVNTEPNGQQTGTQTTYNCMWNATTSDYGTETQFSGQGCSANNNNLNNFGTNFNLVGGGVYAMEWTDEIIQIWSWENGDAPADIGNGTPDPTTWGNPIFTTWGGNCDIARHFIDHTVVFDTTFCGDWGNAAWETSGCYDSVKYPTCSSYVGANPTDYSETYWAVRSLKVYQFVKPVVSSTSTTAAASTSTTSTSSAAATTTAATTTTTAAASTTSSGPEPTFGDWVEVGCYTEATNSRALTLGTKVNYSTMDLGTCAAYCLTLDALYFGVEYGGECYCGDSFEPGSVPSTDGGCVIHCAGNLDETCGGSDRLNVYKYSPAVAPPTTSAAAATSTTSSSSSSAAATTSSAAPSTSISAAASTSTAAASSSTSSSSPSAAPTTSTAAASSSTSSSLPTATSAPQQLDTVGSCERIGCYTEGYEIRALTPFVSTDYGWMSPEVCQSLCPEYSYFGVEFGGECYCGNSINNGSTIVPDSECSMTCGGFPDEYCGAGNRLDLYSCILSSSSSSSLPASPSTSSSLPASPSSTTSYAAAPSSSTSSDPASPSTSSYPAAPSSSTSSSLPAAPSSSTSSYPASPSSSTSSDPASPSTSSYPASPSSSTSSYLASPSSSTSSYPASPSSSTSSYPVSPSSSTGSYPASPSSSTSSYPALPSSSTSSYPASPSSSTSSSSSSYSYGYGNSSTGSSSPSSTHSLSYTTETITTTTIRTISSCAPTVTNCPYGKVLTDTIEITTTYCPGNQSPTSSAAVTTSAPAQTTLTIYTTTVYTVTSCAPTVTNCPAKVGQVTTETIVDYTTVCPVAEASSLASSLGLITAPAAPSTSTSTATSSLTIVKLVTETVKPVAYTPVSYTPSSNYTVAASGSAVTLSSYPSTSPVSYKGAASGLQTGSGLAMFIIVAAAALFL